MRVSGHFAIPALAPAFIAQTNLQYQKPAHQL
jgi:hypothetical protein